MTPEELAEIAANVMAPDFRGHLLTRGQARSIIWREGVLPEGAPDFAANLSYDLLSYGYALLSVAIRARENNLDVEVWREVFRKAANAIEAVITKGDPQSHDRDFHRILAASAFHLAGYSARAYSLLIRAIENANLSAIERSLSLLILRSLSELEDNIAENCVDGAATPDRILASLEASWDAIENEDAENSEASHFDAVNTVLSENFHGALGAFLLALDTGDATLTETAIGELSLGLDVTQELNLVTQWWCYRLAAHLIQDLWSSSLHNTIPLLPPGQDAERWRDERSVFLAVLTKRSRAEIELWPSQIDAATRSVDQSDNLVVSLPTGAGKTRIAELCILRCLASGKRVVFVTPLRALSAQTELSLQKTFGPMGKSISTLYGSIGTSRFESDALKTRDIIVATPEKLDFALRNDPSILDDVGLVVLDEGHMIGLGEREVRYEAQIQRLLSREDADSRRIVCLSAILPDGDQLDDFVSWIRRDQDGDPIKSDWRPTRLRFGELAWYGDSGRLEFSVGEEKPFVTNFISARMPPISQRRTPFPRDQRELVLATAWRLVEDGQSVLIYCPLRASVEPFAKSIVDLNSRGLLPSVLSENLEVLQTARTIGAEWLGTDHPILKCLELGVGIHHGTLPTPFRKEIEKLLSTGVLKITVSSPTLAQGLNLTATSLVIHSLHRNRALIPASEFRNVVGRAGRAFIDIEGQVIFPMFDNIEYRRGLWNQLVNDASQLNIDSGLFRLVYTLMVRLNNSLGKPGLDNLVEYVMNNAITWEFPIVQDEDDDERQKQERDWNKYVSSLDTAILSLIGGEEVGEDQIAEKLDEVLQSSLWERRLEHVKQNARILVTQAIHSRATAIWTASTAKQRKGYFLAGVGLTTGQRLDAIADEANKLLVRANGNILESDSDGSIETITALAELIFAIDAFEPDPLPENWREILKLWLSGESIAANQDIVPSDVLEFVEAGIIFRLSWGVEAVRVRAQANSDHVGEIAIEEFEVGLAISAIETGTLHQSASMLMQAGFTPRLAAIKAVADTNATFTNTAQLGAWLASDNVVGLSESGVWPTIETASIWQTFVENFVPQENRVWSKRTISAHVSWADGVEPPGPEQKLKIHQSHNGETLVLSPTYKTLGKIEPSIAGVPSGLMISHAVPVQDEVEITYIGPNDLQFN